MNKLKLLVSMGLIMTFVVAADVSADKNSKTSAEEVNEAVSTTAWDCGSAIEGNWNVQKAGDIKKHIKHRLKIEKTGSEKYSVKIKNDDGDLAFKSKIDFSLSCNGDPKGGRIVGQVQMGNCMHSLELGVPYNNPETKKDDFDKIYIKITSDHNKGECRGHKDELHEKNPLVHSRIAYAKRPGTK